MKFFAASSVAIIAVVAPSLVSAATIVVSVGASKDAQIGLVFDPQQIIAQRGDTVRFEFRGGNQTVTQSSFANPCAWQFNTVTQQNGFSSGFVPFSPNQASVGTFVLEVVDANIPIWFFCNRAPHCKGGMYGAINPPTTGSRTFAQFAANVQTTAEPGFLVPFTPPNVSDSPGVIVPTSSNNVSTSSGAVPLIKNGAATPNQSSGATGSVAARSTVVLGLAGLAAGLVL